MVIDDLVIIFSFSSFFLFVFFFLFLLSKIHVGELRIFFLFIQLEEVCIRWGKLYCFLIFPFGFLDAQDGTRWHIFDAYA